MTVITKLSDRDYLLQKAILLLTVNVGQLDKRKLRFELFNRGIFVEQTLLNQCISVMIANKILKHIEKPDVEPVQEQSQA